MCLHYTSAISKSWLEYKNCNVALTDVLHRFLWLLHIVPLTFDGAMLECIDMNSRLAVKSCS